MIKSFARLALVASLMVSIGGHWGVLQALAWAGMLHDYTVEKGLAEGIKDTFSGERPCPMCLKLREEKGKSEENNPPAQKEKADGSAKWYDPSFCMVNVLPSPGGLEPRIRFAASSHTEEGRGRCRPAVPPPRSGADHRLAL